MKVQLKIQEHLETTPPKLSRSQMPSQDPPYFSFHCERLLLSTIYPFNILKKKKMLRIVVLLLIHSIKCSIYVVLILIHINLAKTNTPISKHNLLAPRSKTQESKGGLFQKLGSCEDSFCLSSLVPSACSIFSYCRCPFSPWQRTTSLGSLH